MLAGWRNPHHAHEVIHITVVIVISVILPVLQAVLLLLLWCKRLLVLHVGRADPSPEMTQVGHVGRYSP